MFERWLSPEGMPRFFLLLQIAAGILFIGGFWWLQSRRHEQSAFRLREADRKKAPAAPQSAEDELAKARIPKKEPLRLSGIRIDGAPHEILGIPAQATAEQIQRAYRDLMKQYHPDRVGRPGTREWQDAQRIAEALNRAKAEMLSQSASPNRSGR